MTSGGVSEHWTCAYHVTMLIPTILHALSHCSRSAAGLPVWPHGLAEGSMQRQTIPDSRLRMSSLPGRVNGQVRHYHGTIQAGKSTKLRRMFLTRPLASFENQKGTIGVQSSWCLAPLLVLNGTLLNIDNALMVLNRRYSIPEPCQPFWEYCETIANVNGHPTEVLMFTEAPQKCFGGRICHETHRNKWL